MVGLDGARDGEIAGRGEILFLARKCRKMFVGGRTVVVLRGDVTHESSAMRGEEV